MAKTVEKKSNATNVEIVENHSGQAGMVAARRAEMGLLRYEQLKQQAQAQESVVFEPTLIEDKAELVGREFVITAIRHKANGDFGAFVSLSIVIAATGEEAILNDGSTGIYKQVTENPPALPLLVPGGLRVSEYDNPKGTGRSKTYYLSGRAARGQA